MELSAAGRDHIKRYENPAIIGKPQDELIEAYWDSNGYAVGWGSRFDLDGTTIKKGQFVKIKYAELLLSAAVTQAEDAVNRLVTKSLTQGQFDALVDFVYQFGSGRLQNSTLLKAVNQDPKDFAKVNTEFRRWVYVNGKISTNLQKRREDNIIQYAGGSTSYTLLLVMVLVLIVSIVFITRQKS